MREAPRIFIVDDEESNHKLIMRILKPLGYEIFMAFDGCEALERIDEVQPDIMLVDALMPRLDGFEVVRRLKENEKTMIIPIVMVTGLQDTQNRVKAMDAGVDDFLTKPFEVMELRARVKSLLKVKQFHDQLLGYQQKLESEVAARTEELRKTITMLKNASIETIYRLSRAAEYKDEHTGFHVLRVGHSASIIARALGHGNDFVEAMLHASPMHDVGKIGIPDRILLKPGALDPAEMNIMQQHTVMGARILEGSDSELVKLAEVIALTHHEKWNGTGYPQKLKELDIPISGRITAIADVFDALLSLRPYKKPYTIDQSLAIIRDERGKHFEPGIVDVFFDSLDEILSIREQFKDKDISDSQDSQFIY